MSREHFISLLADIAYPNDSKKNFILRFTLEKRIWRIIVKEDVDKPFHGTILIISSNEDQEIPIYIIKHSSINLIPVLTHPFLFPLMRKSINKSRNLKEAFMATFGEREKDYDIFNEAIYTFTKPRDRITSHTIRIDFGFNNKPKEVTLKEETEFTAENTYVYRDLF